MNGLPRLYQVGICVPHGDGPLTQTVKTEQPDLPQGICRIRWRHLATTEHTLALNSWGSTARTATILRAGIFRKWLACESSVSGMELLLL